jgi:hypothetical protein
MYLERRFEMPMVSPPLFFKPRKTNMSPENNQVVELSEVESVKVITGQWTFVHGDGEEYSGLFKRYGGRIEIEWDGDCPEGEWEDCEEIITKQIESL